MQYCLEKEKNVHLTIPTIRQQVAKPYRKNEQSYIESFNRSLRKECVGWIKYRTKDLAMVEKEVRDYLNYYHTKRAIYRLI